MRCDGHKRTIVVVVLRVLVVDDEKPARDDLIWLLDREGDVGDIAEASGGAEALKLLTDTSNNDRFDVVFLDMKMPDLDGLDIARMIGRFEDPPAIVFVTAFDTPASDAFDLGVVDYLRKPVAADRLRRAVQRASVTIRTAADGAEPEVQVERISVSTTAGTQRLLGPEDVTHFESCGDYVRVHTPDETYLIRDTMTRLADGWAPNGFFRIHRSFAVRISAVNEVRSGPAGRSVCVGSVELPVSRRYARELAQRLTGPTETL